MVSYAIDPLSFGMHIGDCKAIRSSNHHNRIKVPISNPYAFTVYKLVIRPIFVSVSC